MTCQDCLLTSCTADCRLLIDNLEQAHQTLTGKHVMGIKRARAQVIHHKKVTFGNRLSFSPEGIFEQSQKNYGVEFEQLAPSKPKRLTKPKYKGVN